MRESQLRQVSVGIVATNKARGSDSVEVALIEHMQFIDGELTDNAETYASQGTGIDGGSFNVKINTTATVQAKWLQQGTNRATPPDVRRGMRVRVYQYADHDEYFWSDMGDNAHLFKLETVTHTYSGTQDEGAAPDANNQYYHEVSTHDGHITVHTTAANGEPHVWDIQLNTKESQLLVTDDIGNSFGMVSDGGVLQLTNYVGTQIKIDGRDVDVTAGGSVTTTCPNNFINGDVTIDGDLAVTGGVKIAGDLTIGGNGTCAGSFTAGQIISEADAIAPNIP